MTGMPETFLNHAKDITMLRNTLFFLFLIPLFGALLAAQAQEARPPYLDPAQPVKVRGMFGVQPLERRDKQIEGCRKFAAGTWEPGIGPGGGFFTLADRLVYEGPRKQAGIFNELQKIAIENTRLGVPLLQIEEGTHGLMCSGGT